METIEIDKTTSEIEYPTVSDRVQSTFMDTIVIIMLMFGIAALLEKMGEVPNWVRIVLFFSVWGVYEPVCTAFGFTIGNYFKGIRVRQVSDTTKRINIFQAILRYIIKVALGIISFLTMHADPKRRALHDFVAGSVMVRVSSGV